MTRVLPLLLLIALCLNSVSGKAAADEPISPTSAEREVRELERRFEQAVVRGDIAFFDRVLAKDFTHTTQTGKFRNRHEWLANHKAGQSHYEALNVDQLAVRGYGNTAVVTARITPHGRDSHGKRIEGQYRYLRVWVKRGDAWQVVAFQSTRLVEAEDGGTP